MATRSQITIDCADPALLTRFWATALGYVVPDPPTGFDDWTAYWRSVGVPDDELGDGDDRLVDPDGVGPNLWFQLVPEGKVVKNRLHLDLDVGGGRDVSLETRALPAFPWVAASLLTAGYLSNRAYRAPAPRLSAAGAACRGQTRRGRPVRAVGEVPGGEEGRSYPWKTRKSPSFIHTRVLSRHLGPARRTASASMAAAPASILPWREAASRAALAVECTQMIR